MNKYNNLLVNLDSLNVVSLTADHIDAGTIDANVVTIRSDLTDGAYVKIDGEGMKINDGTKDTFIADTTGHVTMTGALIQSAAGYPKIVMDPEDELFGAYKSATEFVTLEAVNGVSAAPQLQLNSGAGSLNLYQQASASTIYTVNSRLDIAVDGDLSLDLADPFDSVLVDFNQLEDKALNTTLYQQLLGKAKSGVSTSLSGSANGGIPIGTVLMVSGGGTVTWNGIPSHSHTQN